MLTYMPHLMFLRFFGARLGLLALGLLFVVAIVLLIVVLASRKNKTPAVKAAPAQQATAAAPAAAPVTGDPHSRILDVLRIASEEKQAKGLLIKFEKDYPNVTRESNVEDILASLKNKRN